MRATSACAAFSGAAITLALLVACEDPFALPAASRENVVDTVSLWAVSGTPLERPSAFVILVNQAMTVRTDQTANFDFAFDLDPAGQALLLPTGALRLGRGSGVLVTTEPFDSITVAPGSGYQDSLAVTVSPGTVAVIRSRPTDCFFQLTVSLYAKLRVLVVDAVERRMDFEVLANTNCGYRGLEPGFPTR